MSEFVSCGELAEGVARPVTARALGILLKGREYQRPNPIYLGLKYIDPQVLQRFTELFNFRHNGPKDIWLFRFDGAHVIGQGTVVLADRQMLADSAVEFLNHNIVPDGFGGEICNLTFPHEEAQYIPGRTILVKRPWYRNYGHYLVDLMPILPALKKAGVEVDNIIYGDIPPGNLHTLMSACATQYYPSAKVFFQRDDEPIRADKLYFVQPVHVPPLFKHPEALDLVRTAAREMFPVEPSVSFNSRIYISRARVGVRHVDNEADVLKLLSSKGFTTVYPEEHSFRDQIGMFRSAECVLSVKGAALTNLIFSGPNCSAILLTQSAFIDPFFWDICGYSNSRYSELFCEASDDRSPSMANINVNINLLEESLSANGI